MFFGYATYVTISGFAANIFIFEDVDIIDLTQYTMQYFLSFIIEYLVYLVVMLINFCFYKKRYLKPLVILNILILSIISSVKFDFPLIVGIIAIIGLLFKKKKEIIFMFSIIIDVCLLIIFVISTFFNNLYYIEFSIFAFAVLISMYWAYKIRD